MNTQFRGALVALVSILTVGVANSQHDEKNIIDVAVEAGSFGTLAAALEAADLLETLQGEGPFTVFAPTDEAFAKLPEGTVESLLLPENKDQLTAILTYHVVAGSVMAEQVVGLDEAQTVNGQSVDISVDGAVVMVESANVVAPFFVPLLQRNLVTEIAGHPHSLGV